MSSRIPTRSRDDALLAIARAASSTLEEQGFNSLFLALGFLESSERDTPRRLQKAPLLLKIEDKRGGFLQNGLSATPY